MKFRQGFVTNSSSSSFIVATTNSGGEAFLDMLRFIADHGRYGVNDVITVFPDEAVRSGAWNSMYYPAAFEKARELKSKNVYEIETEDDSELIEILRKASKYLDGFEVVSGEYA